MENRIQLHAYILILYFQEKKLGKNTGLGNQR